MKDVWREGKKLTSEKERRRTLGVRVERDRSIGIGVGRNQIIQDPEGTGILFQEQKEVIKSV